METKTYQRFNHSIELIFDKIEDMELNVQIEEEDCVSPEALISEDRLQNMCREAAKLKILGAMEFIPTERLVRLLKILEKNIRGGINVSPLADSDHGKEESKFWTDILMKKVMRAVDASLISLYIMTSRNMQKRIYLEDVIDIVVLFMKYQLQNTIYPSFVPTCRIGYETMNSSSIQKKRRAKTKEARKKGIVTLYTKLNELIALMDELLNAQVLTDTAIIQVSSVGVSAIFVEGVNDLQLYSLKLVKTIFTKYEMHRKLLLDDILSSIFRLQSNNRSSCSYHLNSGKNIQILTALVLQLVQSVVSFPEGVSLDGNEKVVIIDKYETAMRIAAYFLSTFLTKCGNKDDGIHNRQKFENLIRDLLITVNELEWPASGMLLNVLETILVKNFINKSTNMSLRIISMEYFGMVSAKLKKDAVSIQSKLGSIEQIIKEINGEKQLESEEPDVKKIKIEEVLDDLEPEEKIQFLQQALLDYLATSNDVALSHARNFYIAEWYYEATIAISKLIMETEPSNKLQSKKREKSKKKQNCKSINKEMSDGNKEKDSSIQPHTDKKRNLDLCHSMEERKQFLINKIRLSGDTLILGDKAYIDNKKAELISSYLSFKRPLSQSFDEYLKQILHVLTENCTSIRTKAMKCLTMIVEGDPAVLGYSNIQLGVQLSFLDHSATVREAAIDLVGKFIFGRPELIDKYFDMISARILDSSISVRKRVIKILNKIYIQCPKFSKNKEICLKIIRRIGDEEGIRKLVIEAFQNMWFTPVQKNQQLDSTALIRKIMALTDFVSNCQDTELDCFEQLLLCLFKAKEDKNNIKKQEEQSVMLLTACYQIVDCLIENVLKLEEASIKQDDGQMSGTNVEGGKKKNHGFSQRLVACLMTLCLFAKIKPQLLVNHATTLLPYLSIKCQTKGDYQIISNVTRILQLVVPLMEHPSDTFVAQLEEDCVRLMLLHNKAVVSSCLSCLSSVINNVTHNFKLIQDCFKKYYGHLTELKLVHEKEPSDPRLFKCRPLFRRVIYTVGLILRHFDFKHEEVRHDLPDNIIDQVIETIMYFAHQPNQDMQSYALQAMGFLCVRHYELMLGTELKTLYIYLMTDENSSPSMKIQVLVNIEIYLQEEDKRMIKHYQEWDKHSKKENLKEMNEVSSGMASTIIQLYLKEILELFIHPLLTVRHTVSEVIQLILQQGLVHPAQIIPYLICMTTDIDKTISYNAEKRLVHIESKYPGFINMKFIDGIRLSFKLQRIVQKDIVVRGYRIQEGNYSSAHTAFLYSIVRNNKRQRRAMALSVLKQFDDQTKGNLSQMLYMADNLAYYPFQILDELLFILHHIDIIVSVTGSNLLQDFQEALLPPKQAQEEQLEFRIHFERNSAVDCIQNSFMPLEMNKLMTNSLSTTGEDPCEGTCGSNSSMGNMSSSSCQYYEEEDEDESTLLARLPEDISTLQECITASYGCMLLILLKEHLKDLYKISNEKIAKYSPSESSKVYNKTVTQRNTSCFDPKEILQVLNEGKSDKVLDETAKRLLVQQFLNFKQLMLKLDSNETDGEGDNISKLSKISSHTSECHSATMECDSKSTFEGVGELSTKSSKLKISKVNTGVSLYLRES